MLKNNEAIKELGTSNLPYKFMRNVCESPSVLAKTAV